MTVTVGSRPVLRAWIYNRVSSDPTGRQVSVASQNVENHAFCERQQWIVDRVVTDNDRSASRWATQDRPGYREIRDALATTARPDVLVCWESSRGHRDLEEWLPVRSLCEQHGVLFAYSGRVFDLSRSDDRFTTTLDVLLAEREADTIRDRVMRGVRSAAGHGRPHGTTPYGYRRERDPRTGGLTGQVVDETTGPVVEEITARILGGDTLYGIAADLNARGVLSPQAWKAWAAGQAWEGGGWSAVKIRRLYVNPTVAGQRVHREGRAVHGAVTGGTWPGVITVADYHRVRAVLADPHRARHHRGVEVKYLLSGIGECGPCGAWLRPQTVRGAPSYVCAGHGPGSGKGHVSRLRLDLDAWVTSIVVDWLADPGLLADVAARELAVADRGTELRVELAELRARLAQAETAVVGAAAGTAQEAMARIVVAVAAQIDEREAELSRVVPVSPLVAGVAGPGAAARWADLSVGQRRELVRGLGRVVVWPVAARGRRGFDPSTVEVTRRRGGGGG